MALNYVWIAFFLISFIVALIKLVFFQDYTIFQTLVNSTFDMSKTAAELSLGLVGIMTFWLGIMRLVKKAE
jgi:spore maturation protein SpmA